MRRRSEIVNGVFLQQRGGVAFNGKPDVNVFTTDQLIARVMKFDGAKVSYLTPSFFPFISADNTNNSRLAQRGTLQPAQPGRGVAPGTNLCTQVIFLSLLRSKPFGGLTAQENSILTVASFRRLR